jgi:hypothetical protein
LSNRPSQLAALGALEACAGATPSSSVALAPVVVRGAEQATRLQEQRAKPAAGEGSTATAASTLIEPPETAAETYGTLVHAGDCERQRGSSHESEDDFDETE